MQSDICLTLSWRRLLLYRDHSICITNQWAGVCMIWAGVYMIRTGLYMIGTSIMKELKLVKVNSKYATTTSIEVLLVSLLPILNTIRLTYFMPLISFDTLDMKWVNVQLIYPMFLLITLNTYLPPAENGKILSTVWDSRWFHGVTNIIIRKDICSCQYWTVCVQTC